MSRLIPKNIVFFDGECMLCNFIVQYLFKLNIENLYFSELQSDYAEKLLSNYNISTQNLNTFYFYQNGEIYNKSSAAIQVLKLKGGVYKFTAHILSILPVKFRDFLYDLIAQNRHRFFKKTSCLMPTAEQRSKILS